MKIRYAKVRVRISETNIRTITVYPWEVPILQAVHGEGTAPTGEFVEKEVETLPDAGSEFERLAVRYRGPTDGDTPYVGLVYGSYGIGVAKLGEQIQAAAVQDKAKKPRKAAEKPAPAKDNLASLLGEGEE
jgi:hypothetical protein